MAFPSNPIYKLVKNPRTGELCNIRSKDDLFIPFDPDNTDYQEYLEWVSKGNTAEEAD